MNLQFMFELGLPALKSEEFVSLIPEQRSYINDCLLDSKILNYSLSADMTKLWCVVESENESTAYEIIAEMPLAAFMKIKQTPLMFHHAVFHHDFQFSKN